MRWDTCISVLLVAAAVAETLCNDVASDLPIEKREKRQLSLGSLTQTLGGSNRRNSNSNSNRGRTRTSDRMTNSDYRDEQNTPDLHAGDNASGRQILGVQARPLSTGTLNNLGGTMGISLGIQTGGLGISGNVLGLGGGTQNSGSGGGGQQNSAQNDPYNNRPNYQARPQPNGGQGPQGPESGRPQPGEGRPPGHQGRPGNNPPGLQGGRPPGRPNQGFGPSGRPEDRPGRPDQGFGPPGEPGERPGSYNNARPGESNGFQNSRPGDGGSGQPGGRPGERPGDYQGFQNGRPGDETQGLQGGEYNNRPGESQGFQNGRPDQDRIETSGQRLRPGEETQGYQNNRPGGESQGQRGQNVDQQRPGQQNYNRPITENSGNQNSRPGQNNAGRPGETTNSQQNNGNNAQQSGSQNRDEDRINPYNAVSTESQPQSNQGQGNKKCRGNQYTCQNRECVPRNARCNGINECQDGSDENNCYSGQNRPDQGSSSDYTTAAPTGSAHPSATSGCILPEQPTGGRYELDSCKRPCVPTPGSTVALSSFLTYSCNEGYNLKGNNVSFCHNKAWYLPPTCVKTCSPLKSNSVDIICKLDGAIVSCESNISPGTKATLACKHSYKLPLADDPVYRDLTCLEEGVWDRTLFRCLPECGTAVAHGNTLIVNGFTAKLGVFPWHVGIYQRTSAGSYMQICAGTLISPVLVISAAHCFYDDTVNEVEDASNYAVAAGKHYRSYNAHEKYVQKSMVKKIDVATRYYGASGNFAEDISLVHLETTFTLSTLVRPICMDWDNRYEREQLQSGKTGKAVGWGKNAAGVPSEELQEINLPFIPYQQCVSAVPEEFKGYVTADKFCAGYLNGSSLCEGDSGGGLCFQLDGLWYLRGIVSVSPVSQNTCDNHYYTAFTNVGRFREWIRAAYISAV
ncbi:uncharacterized protein LOC124406926 [Diprion similis]|uniref:uncharacterized protein LOC124406926 n=1 Tax=Diprion similis TaxID=362088 RepID=UPI001EF85B9D|nr:uncharacterized protein LOC124406926 [Diprion similis]